MAVARSNQTATRKVTSAGFTSRVTASSAETADTSAGPLLPKTARSVSPAGGALRARAVPSMAACAAVAPGRNRATALNSDIEVPGRPALTTGGTYIGSHACVSRSGKVKSAGITPTIVYG